MKILFSTDGSEISLFSLSMHTAAAEQGAALGKGLVLYHPAGLETLAPAALAALVKPRVRLLSPGKVAINRTQSADGTVQAIHLVNYDFRYEVSHPGRYASDDGSAEARTFFGQPGSLIG